MHCKLASKLATMYAQIQILNSSNQLHVEFLASPTRNHLQSHHKRHIIHLQTSLHQCLHSPTLCDITRHSVTLLDTLRYSTDTPWHICTSAYTCPYLQISKSQTSKPLNLQVYRPPYPYIYRAYSARAMTHHMQWIPKLNAPTSNSQKWSTKRNYRLQFRNYVKQDPANTLKLLKNMESTRVRFIVGSQAKPSLFMNFSPPHQNSYQISRKNR